ncbi:3-oxoacyl-ACP reductase FabG [Bradyrhizobium sp. WSM 1738]|uniref:3-oxoacyl-ACP reductase FabG n=1 Tax=Bradyrhizobium hereditatis TaxID=2821405 RepID=UPI001CE33871|nr:3-oxoacyl-ACP reductase FabG [Bradyrhizobium hereditatis]MCA6120112.1 3-oxoacyl-ACP reductase FabG [Bradyrhizobium hereditatis]
MNGKVLVISGALGALGKEVAEIAMTRGARIAAIDLLPSKSLQTPGRLEICGVDLTDPGQAKMAIDKAAAHFGKLDALLNLAGGFVFETLVEGDSKTWQRMYAMNVLTAINASRVALPYLARSTAGRIVNVGSIAAVTAGGGMGPYAASKSSVHRFTEALAAECKGQITVNAVLPSVIDTAVNRTSMPGADFAKWVQPREVAELILFLVSDAASAVTGALIPVAGRG